MTHLTALADVCRDDPFPVAHPAEGLLQTALNLLDAITDDLSRRLAEDALCGPDPELHTGPNTGAESADEQAAREQVAREVCAECPVQQLCLNRAVRLRPKHGVWAGLTAAEVNTLADQLASGRPFKEVA
ncbi:WhiB family transcriptional regulator [Streptosporangium sp. G11]|uniref:WhiB family transcriptional regulator n=1 Tax=Streptosporangium sp. G11 TaxID=3436926 RepID=UPI003EB7C035